MLALDAIYGTDAVVVSAERVQIHLDDGRLMLDLRLPRIGQYPAESPLVALRWATLLQTFYCIASA